ncbi:MAG TPA: secretin N-terminal domain-containing protein [Thermoanaerobaculaceae bacterium]|nr:secretin N-terminal domain-containing protein [Thermoanaerobaculaceae bacterium]
MKPIRTVGAVLLVSALLPACATYRYTRKADEAVVAENWDAAVYYYLEALARDPGNATFKMGLQRARTRAGEEHFKRGMKFKEVGELQRAQTELELAIQLDPTHQYAEVELAKVRKDLAVLSEEGGAQKLAEMKKEASEMKVKPPALNPASDEPLSLSFPTERSVRDIYKAIGQAFGLNILFDPKLRDSKLSIELKDVTARQALEAVMQAAGHFYKVLDEKTVIVVEDTPQNRRDYEDLVVKTFFLSNGDVKDVNNMLRALIDARRIAINEQLNSIVIRDTADKVAIAERLINANDKAKAEVLVDVELLQLDTSKIRDIGSSLSSYSFSPQLDTTKLGGATSTSPVYLNKLNQITRSMWNITVPSLTINLIKSAGEAETLAQPQLRITEREKANLVIGEKVPIPTTTFNTTQTVGGNIVPITAFQYQDVGIKLDIEPRVHHNNEVTLKLKVEVSELGAQITVATGETQPAINTRSIDTVIRLKDGETSLLAGLLKVSKNTTTSGMPWLSDIPVIGRLFSDTSRNFTQTDLVLTLTPHIIRYPDITEEDLAPLWVGTENRISVFGNSPRVRSAVTASPFGGVTPGLGVDRGVSPDSGDEGVAPPSQVSPEQQETRPVQQGPVILPPKRVINPGSPKQQNVSPDEKSGWTGAGPQGQAAAADAPQAAVTAQGAGIAAVQPDAAAASGQTVGTAAQATGVAAQPTLALTQLSFYPARLPVIVGQEGQLTVVLDPGTGGASGPLHFAYDPARLEITRIEGGDLPNGDRNLHVEVGHTPALGFITASWNGAATGSGTLMRLTVRPRDPGEIPIVFAGPAGTAAVAPRPAAIVALPAALAVGGGAQPR